jgi:hypothetical protein
LARSKDRASPTQAAAALRASVHATERLIARQSSHPTAGSQQLHSAAISGDVIE